MADLRANRELTGPFWAAVDRGELVRPVCDQCGRSFFTPQVVCPHCQSSAWTYQKSAAKGRIYSHTTVHRPPDPSFPSPYVIADVQVEEGWRMLTWIVNCDPESVRIDMPVQVCFVPGPDGEVLPAFEPEPSS